MIQTANVALTDIKAAWRDRHIAIAFAAEDVQDVYRQTRLGPLWMLVSFVLFILAIVFIAGQTSMPNYLAFAALGFLVFNFISDVLIESTSLFRREQNYIKGTTLPISGYIFRATFRTLLREAFPMVAAFTMVLYTGLIPTGAWLYSLLAIVAIVLTAPAVYVVVGIGSVYFPDLSFVMANLVRLAFFLSPILWDHGNDPVRKAVFDWNPITHYITIVRDPILTGNPALHSWSIVIGLLIALWLLAIFLLGRFRHRLVFML